MKANGRHDDDDDDDDDDNAKQKRQSTYQPLLRNGQPHTHLPRLLWPPAPRRCSQIRRRRRSTGEEGTADDDDGAAAAVAAIVDSAWFRSSSTMQPMTMMVLSCNLHVMLRVASCFSMMLYVHD